MNNQYKLRPYPTPPFLCVCVCLAWPVRCSATCVSAQQEVCPVLKFLYLRSQMSIRPPGCWPRPTILSADFFFFSLLFLKKKNKRKENATNRFLFVVQNQFVQIS